MLEGLAAIHTFDTARENACLRVVKTVRWAADITLSPLRKQHARRRTAAAAVDGSEDSALSAMRARLVYDTGHHLPCPEPPPRCYTFAGRRGENKKKWIPIRPRIHTCPDCCRAFITPNGLLRHRVVKHGLRAPRPLEMSIRLTCEETPGHLLVCPGLQALREKHDMETPHGVKAVADVKLANFLLVMIRHIPHPYSLISSESRPGVAANGTDNAISQVPSADSSLIDASSEGVSNRRRRRDGADEVPPPRSRIVQYRGGRFAVID